MLMRLKSLVFSMASILLLAACSPASGPVLEVTNPYAQPVKGKAFVLNRAEVERLVQSEVPSGMAVKVTNNKGQVLAVQLDDLNGNQQWDELVFQADFAQEETLHFSFEVVEAAELDFPQRTNVRFARRDAPYEEVQEAERLHSVDSPTISAVFQMEGPAWENDVVGFRNYYDARNGMDIFGKRTAEMVLDKAGIEGQDYHSLDEWGMDILKVGTSLGAGALAIGFGEELYRVGPAEKGGYRLISEGPVRAVFDLTFEGVPAGDRLYDLTHRISIYAGDHFYRSEVWVEGLQGDEFLYTGIVDMHELPVFEVDAEGFRVFGTHGNQGFMDEVLGLGIIIPDQHFVHYKAAPKSGAGIIETHLTALQLLEGLSAEYAFAAGWEYQDNGFTNAHYFQEVLKQSAQKLDSDKWQSVLK